MTSGTILIGTTDGEGNDFETVYDLSRRQVTGTRDATELRNQTVTCGELLFQDITAYTTQVSVTPATVNRNTTNLGLTISGNFSTTLPVSVSVTGGVQVVSVRVVNSTTVSAVINVPTLATVGNQTVTVTQNSSLYGTIKVI